MLTRTSRRTVLTGVGVVLILGAHVAAATLESRTIDAYNTYFRQVVGQFTGRTSPDGFLWLDERPDRRRAVLAGEVVVTGAVEDGIVEVPAGLIHHWIGGAFIKGVTRDEMIALVQSYADYPRIHEPVMAAELLGTDGDTHRIYLRIRKGTRFVTAVLDTWWRAEYHYLGADRAYTTSHSESVQQVERAGEPGERRLPADTGGGYVWRASTFTRFFERDGGTYVEFQTLALSRAFPALLGWIVEPIARRIGASSVKDTLLELRQAATGARARPSR